MCKFKGLFNSKKGNKKCDYKLLENLKYKYCVKRIIEEEDIDNLISFDDEFFC